MPVQTRYEVSFYQTNQYGPQQTTQNKTQLTRIWGETPIPIPNVGEVVALERAQLHGTQSSRTTYWRVDKRLVSYDWSACSATLWCTQVQGY